MPSDPTVEPYPSPEPLEKLADYNTMRLLHAAIGMGTEAAEILDAMHKHIFQGEPLDYANLEEEYGDSSWYMRLAATALRKFTGGGLYQIIVRNIAKLKKRYPDKFTAEAALNRDLDSERQIFDQRV
jgi:NTP pyrophosphatase (non-canonical NTP hydrolase)